MRTLQPPRTQGGACRWRLDPAFGTVEFAVSHLGIGSLRGHFDDVALLLEYEREAPESTRLELLLGPQSVRAGAHGWAPLAADVFNAGGFGPIHFRSHDAEVLGAAGLALDGELTVRGITLPATLQLEIRGEATDSAGAQRIGLAGSLRFSRRAFGIRWPEGQDATLADELLLALDAELVHDEEPPSAA